MEPLGGVRGGCHCIDKALLLVQCVQSGRRICENYPDRIAVLCLDLGM